MARLRGMAPQNDGRTSTGDFYSASKASVYPTYHPKVERIPGQSKYPTAEAEMAARPYADVGKFSVSMFGQGTGVPPDQTNMPKMPGAEQILREGYGLNIPGQNYLGTGIDFLANLASPVTQRDEAPGFRSAEFFNRLKSTPDMELDPVERQIKGLNSGLFGSPADSPQMQGKQMNAMYKAFLVADAHSKGQSSIIQADSDLFAGAGPSVESAASPLGSLLSMYGLVSGLWRRAVGGGVVDQLQVLKDSSDEDLGEERLAIKKQWEAGTLNDAEARDSIAMSSFALTNPNPIKTGDEFGPVDTIANMAIAMGGEFIGDPLSAPAIIMTGGGYAAKAPIQTTLLSIERSLGRAAIKAEAETLGRTAAEHAAKGGQTVYQSALKEATAEAERLAGEMVAKQASLRRLPKSATIAAKQGQKVEGAAIQNSDRLSAYLEMGADPSHPWSAAIREGIEGAGMHGQVAVRAPKVIRMAEALDKMTDPFSLYGYYRTGRTVPLMASKMASHGFMDAVGWRVARRLDSAYAEAGVNPDVAENARYISAANHTVQAGDRANTQRMVSVNSAFIGPESPTEQAIRHAERRPGDIRSLVRDQVDKTLEFIVPATKGGRAQAMSEWRQRAARQLMDMGASKEGAEAVAGRMDERMMRALANDHYGYIIDRVDAAKRGAGETPTWDTEAIGRITYMGPRQMAQQDVRNLAKAIAANDIAAVRAAVRRFRDLNQNISESLDDAELVAQVKHVMGQIEGALPVRIDDTTDLPKTLVDFLNAHPGYSLMLRPDDNNLLVPVRNAMGRVTGANTWLDNITGRTPSVEVTRFKAFREELLRGIAGGELERNAGRRFAQNMAEYVGLSELESSAIMRAIRATADLGETSPRGLSTDAIIKSVDNALGMSFVRKDLAKRAVIDALFDAYENEMRLVGVLPKLTGWVKTQATGVAGNSLGWLTDYLYPKVRFNRNPLFFAQEVPEAAFFLALQGRYPIANIVPDPVAAAMGPLGRGIRESKARTRIWNERTMVVMDRMVRTSQNAENDFYTMEELVRMGLTQAAQLTDPRTALGKLLKKVGTATDLRGRKARSVALAYRAELGETWKAALMNDAPEQWRAVRAFYPDDMSDGEVAVEWMLDLFARGDPDSIYSVLSPAAFRPSHIGARAEVSDVLIRHIVYGEGDAGNHTWGDLVQEIRDGTTSIDQVRNDLTAAGADPDYVERAVRRLEFGTADEFYDAAVAQGVPADTVASWRSMNSTAAGLQGITEEEYLVRNFVGRPLAVDQMGNLVGDTLFDDIVAGMKTRGKAIPDSDSVEVAELKRVANEMITDVLRPAPVDGEVVPVPKQLPRGSSEDAKKAASKVRGWEKTRVERAADPTLHEPPMQQAGAVRKGEPVPGYTLEFSNDPLQYPYIRPGETGYQATARASEIGVTDLRGVTVRDADGNPIAFVYANLDEATNTLRVSQSQVLNPHGRKGIGNWMYRQLEEQTGATIMPVRDQSDSARALWAQQDRPFGPQERSLREYQTGIETGAVRVIGTRETPAGLLPDPGKEIPEEYWPPDIDTFNDPTLAKMKPIQMTRDGKFVGADDRARAQVAEKRGVRVRVEVMDFREPGTGARVPPARFGRDARGNATRPSQFRSEEGYVYRTLDQEYMGGDWGVGTYVAKHPATIYAKRDTSVVIRTRQDVTGWDEAVGGVDASQNLQSRSQVWAEDVEYLGDDGQWHPVIPQASKQPLFQTAFHTIGVTTPRQYQRQIMTMMDPVAMGKRGMRAMTEKDVKLAIEWYDHMRRATFALVDDSLTGDERIMAAARVLVAFGTTQLNTSPADGFRHVFKAYGMKARGETLQMDEARNIVQQAVGLNPEQLHALVWNDQSKISQMGIAQKLFDFIDSLTGSKTRTNGITGPKGDWGPVAVDVHTKRDFGYLDDQMGDWVYRLIERQKGTELVRGISSKYIKGKGFVIEMSDGTTEIIPQSAIGKGVPTDGEYDYGVELGNDIRDHFNEIRFMDREWSSYEVQALGWYRMQLLKSSEGDAGEVANAIYEQSRWMGSNDLVPSERAPMNEVFPWDDVNPEYIESIVVNGAHHASDEAEMASGARVLTKTDQNGVVHGTYRMTTTVELATDVTGAQQYANQYGLHAEQDVVILMRDMPGKPRAPRYHGAGPGHGVGISVDIPVRDQAQADDLMQRLAVEEGGALRAIGPRTFVAKAYDGSLHLRTLWEPSGPKADRNAFNAARDASGLAEQLGDEATFTERNVEYVRAENDWAANTDGEGYMDVIERGSHRHPVIRTPQQREALVAQYDAAYAAAQEASARAARMRDNNPAKAAALKATEKAEARAKKEMEVARATPAGRPVSDVRELVRESRLRVRTGVAGDFDKYAAREVRHARERVIGEARDGAEDALGTDPRWDDVLDVTRGSNGERLYERTPGGTIRAAVTRASSADRRSQLYFNRGAVTPQSVLHEVVHMEANNYDDSAVRAIKGVFAGLEGTPYGTHTPGTPLTEAEHEWMVAQFFLWASDPDSVHPVMAPLLKHLQGKLGSVQTLKARSTQPSRDAMKRLDGEIAILKAKRATLKQPRAIARIDADIAVKQGQRAAAEAEAKAIRAGGGLSPEIKKVLDDIAASAGARSETKASTYSTDEQNMLEWAQISMASSQKRANDLVHMRGERSMMERSINHPFLGLYPSSYMYGKVLPYLTEFMMFRPFGLKAPMLPWTMGQNMNQSFNRQQQYDSELRNFLYKNEPFLRAMALFVPGVPWDLPANTPIWVRRITENWMTNAVRRMNGQKEVDMDIPSMIVDSAMYNLTLRGTDSWSPIIQGAQQAPDIAGAMVTGERPPPRVQQPAP